MEKLFGMTLFLDRPTPRRLHAWRAKAQQAAAERAGYAFQSYAQAKFTAIVEELAELVFEAAPGLDLPGAQAWHAVDSWSDAGALVRRFPTPQKLQDV